MIDKGGLFESEPCAGIREEKLTAMLGAGCPLHGLMRLYRREANGNTSKLCDVATALAFLPVGGPGPITLQWAPGLACSQVPGL